MLCRLLWITAVLLYGLMVIWALRAIREYVKISRGIMQRIEEETKGTKPPDPLQTVLTRTDAGTWSMSLSLIGSVLLCPIRFGLFTLATATHFVVSLTLMSFMHNSAQYTDQELSLMKENRPLIQTYNEIIGRLTLFGIWLAGLRVKEHTFNANGEIKTDETPDRHQLTTVIANHTAAVDILYFVARVQAGFVAKAAVRDMPLIGSIAAILGTVFVDRAAPSSREVTLEAISERQNHLNNQAEANRKSAKPSTNLRPIVIFPEGTTTSGVGVLPFKRGAFYNPNSTVNPVILTYTAPAYNPWVWIPTFDIIELWVYVPLVLCNLGFCDMNVYWFDEPLRRSPQEDCETFTDRCEHFIRANLAHLRKYGKPLGMPEGDAALPQDSISPASLRGRDIIATKRSMTADLRNFTAG